MRNFLTLSILILSLLALSSCISNKKIVYLQSEEPTGQYTNEAFTKKYKIKSNDLLDVKVTSIYPDIQELLSAFVQQQGGSGGNVGSNSSGYFYINGFVVDDAGNVKLPMVGEVKAAGKTIRELEDDLEAAFLEYYDGITVVVKLGGLKISMLGEFNQPGTRTFFEPNVTVLEAIASAGDFTQTANRKEVMLLRTSGSEMERVTIDLTDEDLLESEYFYLKADDVLYAKPLKVQQYGFSRNALQYTLTILSAISSSLLIINLVNQFSSGGSN